jgi:hypothetical protein
MTLHVFVLATGEITGTTREFEVDPSTILPGEDGYLAPAKGRWARVVDEPPAFDARWQSRAATRPDVVAEGDVEVEYAVAARPLAEVKATRMAALAAYRYERETGGITLGGASIRTDRESQALVSGAFQLVQIAPETVIDWKGSAGWVQLDAATMAAIAVAVATHVQACFSAEKTHAEAIDACATAEEAGTYDFTAGWP